MSMTLKAARVNKNLNQNQAAELIGVTKQTICKWENGITLPSVKYLKLIEQAYEVPYENLIFISRKSN